MITFLSDLHPYACGNGCLHCERARTVDHDPDSCAFCLDDDGRMPSAEIPVRETTAMVCVQDLLAE